MSRLQLGHRRLDVDPSGCAVERLGGVHHRMASGLSIVSGFPAVVGDRPACQVRQAPRVAHGMTVLPYGLPLDTPEVQRTADGPLVPEGGQVEQGQSGLLPSGTMVVVSPTEVGTEAANLEESVLRQAALDTDRFAKASNRS